MREVYLAPEHSKWWLLSPGMTLYYDKINILSADFDKAQQESGQSSYHDQLAGHLDAFTRREDYPEISVVSDFSIGSEESLLDEAQSVFEDLTSRASSDDDPTLIPDDLIQLTADAFRHWIDYNKGKVRFLRKDEAYRKLLGSELIPAWESRLLNLQRHLEAPAEERLGRFLGDADALSTFKRLLTSSCRCIRLVDSGKQIYDPMLVEYLPAIQLIESRRISEKINTDDGNISPMFEAFRIKMSRYTEIVPVDLSIDSVGKAIEDFSRVRSSLERLDSTIQQVSDSDLKSSVHEVEAEIRHLLELANSVEKGISYGFWVSGIVWSVASVLGVPKLSSRVGEAAAALAMATKNVGKFAGAYSIITDRAILNQDTVVSRSSYGEIDYEYFKKHYWDFGKGRA
jgi:hypothetical protein